MRIHGTLGLAATATFGAVIAWGCSSTDTASPAGDDGGAGDAAPDRKHPASDAGDDSSGDDASNLVCPPDDTSGYHPDAYVSASGGQGVCAPSAVAVFVTACGDNGTQGACDTWIQGNVASDAGAGTACGNCIIAPQNNGGVWTDPQGYFDPNYAGCVQLLDTNGGAACAAKLDALAGCEAVACDSCNGTSDDYDACVKAADQAGCSAYASAYQSACGADLADGGALSVCSPGAANGTLDPDFTYIITLICGGSGDGGTDAAGEGGASDAAGDAPPG